MDVINNLMGGFATCLTLNNIWMAVLGAFLGTMVGILPGLGPSATMAIILPITFGMDPTPAMIMLCSLYYGAMYGGSTTSILVNVPGEASSVDHGDRGPPARPAGEGGNGPRPLRHRLLLRRHHRHDLASPSPPRPSPSSASSSARPKCSASS